MFNVFLMKYIMKWLWVRIEQVNYYGWELWIQTYRKCGEQRKPWMNTWRANEVLLLWEQANPDASDPWEMTKTSPPHAHSPGEVQKYSKAFYWCKCKWRQCVQTLVPSASSSRWSYPETAHLQTLANPPHHNPLVLYISNRGSWLLQS